MIFEIRFHIDTRALWSNVNVQDLGKETVKMSQQYLVVVESKSAERTLESLRREKN